MRIVGEKRNRLFNALRLALIAVCFVAVFTLSLAFGEGVFDAPDASVGNVAEATHTPGDEVPNGSLPGWQSGTAGSFLTMSPIQGDNGDFDLNTLKDDSGVGLEQSTSTSWTFTETFNNHKVTLDNQGAYKSNCNNTYVRSSTDKNTQYNMWEIGNKEPFTSELHFAIGILYQVPTQLNQLAKEDKNNLFTIKIEVTFGNIRWSGASKHVYACFSTSSSASHEGKEFENLSTKNLKDIKNNNSAGESDNVSYTYTINDYNGAGYILAGGKVSHSKPSFIASGDDVWIYLSELTIKYTVTLNNTSNTNDPKATGVYTPNTRTEDVTESNKDNYSFYAPNDEIIAAINEKKDNLPSISDSTVINMISYVGNKDKQTVNLNGEDYNWYKQAALTLNSGSNKQNCLRVIKIGDGSDATIYVASSLSTGKNKVLPLRANNKEVGRIKIEITDYATVQATLYFADNAPYNSETKNGGVAISITQFGPDKTSISFTLNVDGIDPNDPTTEVTLNNNSTAKQDKNIESANWLQTTVFDELSIANNSNGGVSQQVWYYAVRRTNDLAALKALADISAKDFYDTYVKTGKLDVLSFDSMSFVYSFTDGKAGAKSSSGTVYDKSGNLDSNPVTGDGFYRFDFYTYDLAGNNTTDTTMSRVKSYFVKVDYKNLSIDYNMSYDDDASGRNVQILSSTNGPLPQNASDANVQSRVWATGELSMTFKVELNYMGNTVYFKVGDSSFTIILTSSYTVSEKSGTWSADIKVFSGTTSVEPATDGTYELKCTDSANHDIIITLKFTQSGSEDRMYELKLGVKDSDKFDFVDFNTTYVAKKGLESGGLTVGNGNSLPGVWQAPTGWTPIESLVNPSNDKHTVSKYMDTGVYVLIDRHAPDTPTFGETEKLQTKENSVFGEDFSIDKLWYTDSVTFSTVVKAYADAFLASEAEDKAYKNNFYVGWRVKTFATLDEFKTFITANKDNKTFFQTADSFDDMQKNAWQLFGHAINDNQQQLNLGNDTTASVALNSINSVGIKLVVLFAKDQAGLYSGCSSYVILADANDYDVSTAIEKNDIADNAGIASITANKTSVKRGGTVNVTMTFGSMYAPFKLMLNSDVILFNYSAACKWQIAEGYDSLISGANDGFDDTSRTSSFSYVLDNNGYGKLGNAVTFTLACRLIVDETYRVDETTAPIDWYLMDASSRNVFYNRNSQEPRFIVNPISGIADNTENLRKAFEFLYFKVDGEKLTKIDKDNMKDSGTYYVLAYIPNGEVDEEGKKVTANTSYVFKGAKLKLREEEEGESGLVMDWSYAFSDGAFTFDGISEWDFVIAPLAVTASINEENAKAVYGKFDPDMLNGLIRYTDDNFTAEIAEAEGFKFDLSLDLTGTGIDWEQIEAKNALEILKLGVGKTSYQILLSFNCNNYTVTLDKVYNFNITPNELKVDALNAQGVYGDPVEVYKYGVKRSQFENSPAWSCLKDAGNIDECILFILDLSLSNYAPHPGNHELSTRYDFDEDTGYFVFEVEGSENSIIKRKDFATKDVKSYDYAETANFAGANAILPITFVSSTGKFTITQREVVLVVGGSTVMGYMAEPSVDDVSKYIPDPSLSDKELSLSVAMQNTILEQVKGKIMLGEAIRWENPVGYDDYSAVLRSLITFAAGDSVDDDGHTYITPNVKYIIEQEQYYLFLFSAGDAILVRFNEGALVKNYGMAWDNDWLKFVAGAFTLERADGDESKMPKYDRITWEVQLYSRNAPYSEQYPTVGAYEARFVNAHMYLGGVDVQNDAKTQAVTVNVVAVPVTYNPAAVKVRATLSQNFKTYGEQESAYGINFEIYEVNGEEFNEGSTLADMGYATLKSKITGSYVRALYNVAGDGYRSGSSQFDNASDDMGVAFKLEGGEVVSDDYYYALYNNGIRSNDSNLSVTADEGKTTRLQIKQKQLTITLNNFRGAGKMYNGDAVIPNPVTYIFDDGDILNNDAITLVFDAVYDQAGVAHEDTNVGIIISNIRLNGARVMNYELFEIVNPNAAGEVSFNATLKNGEAGEKQPSLKFAENDDIIAIIFYMKNGDNTEAIVITGVNIVLKQSDFTITKVYDNNGLLYIGNITFTYLREEESGSNAVLYNEFNKEGGIGEVYLVGSAEVAHNVGVPAYSDVHALGNYHIGFTLRFYVENATHFGSRLIPDSGIAYRTGTTDDKGEYINVIFTNMSAQITPLMVDASYFDKMDAEDREYNAKDGINVVPTFNAKLPDFANAARRIRVTGHPVDEKGEHTQDAGTWMVVIDKVEAVGANASDFEFDMDSICRVFSAYVQKDGSDIKNEGDDSLFFDVVISKAKLRILGRFENRMYDGLTYVTLLDENGEPIYYFTPKRVDGAIQKDEQGNVLYDVKVADRKSFTLTLAGHEHGLIDDSENDFTELRAELKKLVVSFADDGGIFLSDKGEINPNVMFDGEAVAEHNVIFKGMSIKDENGYLKNYTLDGVRFADGEYQEIENETFGEEPIADFELEGVMTLTRRAFQVLEESIIIPDKVYDGTTSVDITVIIPENDLDEENRFFVADKDRPYLSIMAAANFVYANAGTNIPIRFTEMPKLNYTGEDAAAGEIMLKNYEPLTYSREKTGTIKQRPVSATVVVQDKVYDSTPNIDPSAVSYEFNSAHFIAGDQAKYSLWARGGAYFTDKNVQFDAEGNIIAKRGAVIDPTLRNNRTGDMDYELVVISEKREVAPDMFEIVSASGEVLLRAYYRFPTKEEEEAVQNGSYVNPQGTVSGTAPEMGLASGQSIVYYYPLPIVGNYYSEYNKDNANKIISAYSYGGGTVYLGDGGEGTLSSTVTYLAFESGKIEQKEVYLDANKLHIINPAPFHKVYDGTDLFFGERYKDYFFSDDAIKGLVECDFGKVKIKSIVASFNSAGTDASAVTFNIDEIFGNQETGEDESANYKVIEAGSRLSASYQGSISKLHLSAILQDGSIEYGTLLYDNNRIAESNYTIAYKLGDKEVTLFSNGGEMYFYMKYEDFCEAMGYKTDDKFTGKESSYERLNAFRFNFGESGERVDSESGEYIRLEGAIMSLPYATATFDTARPNAGTVVDNEHFVLNGGESQFFTFAYVNEGSLTVERRHLYVSIDVVSKTEYQASYGATWRPAYNIVFYDRNGNLTPLASWDNISNVFIIDGVDYSPVVEWVIFNSASGEITSVGAYPKLTSELDENCAYVARLRLPSVAGGLDAYRDKIINYYFHIGENEYEGDSTIFGDEFTFFDSGIEFEDGKYYLKYKCEAYFGNNVDYETVPTATLNLTLPDPSTLGVSVPNTEYTFTYNGQDQLASAIMGYIEGDQIGLVSEEDVAFDTVNVGSNAGTVKLTRKIKIDDGDEGKEVVWYGNAIVTFIVEKADIRLSALPVSSSYGLEQAYDVADLVSWRSDIPLAANITAEMFDVNFYQGESRLTEQAFKEANVGTYRVEISINSDKFSYIEGGENMLARNFITESEGRAYYVSADYSVLPSVVEISITGGSELEEDANSGAVKRFVGTYYEDKEYTVDFTFNQPDLNIKNYGKLQKTDFSVKFMREQEDGTVVNAPGRYTFRVTLPDDIQGNYRLTGESGVLELFAKKLDISGDDNVDKNGDVAVGATVEVMDDSRLIANRIIVHSVTQEGTANDSAVYNAIAAYMPKIHEYARVSSILQIALYYDAKIVNTTGVKLKLSVALPSSVKEDMSGTVVYKQTSEGGLEKLEYDLEEGRIVYETDYLGALVFVNVEQPTLPNWLNYLIIGAGSLIIVFVLGVLVAFIARKSKLGRLDKKKYR